MLFRDRVEAGKALAERLVADRADAGAWDDPIVLGLPRGGVPVAAEVASALGAPLDALVVRKLGAPTNREFAIGAIGPGIRVLDERIVAALGVTEEQVAAIEAAESAELRRREQRYRAGLPPLQLESRAAIIVDDGLATGSTARAACRVARALGAARVVLAVPVAPPDWQPMPGEDADEFVCLQRPAGFVAIGQWYHDFTQTTDEEVLALLAQHR